MKVTCTWFLFKQRRCLKSAGEALGRYLLEQGIEEQVTEAILEYTVGVLASCSVCLQVHIFHIGTDIPTSVYRDAENSCGCGNEIRVIGTYKIREECPSIYYIQMKLNDSSLFVVSATLNAVSQLRLCLALQAVV